MNKDIKEAVNFIEQKNYVSKDKYYKSYLFSNENLIGVNKAYNVNKKEVLTVLGGGDQYLSFLLNEAKKIDTYDINIFSEYVVYLKIAAIKSLSYEEFLAFYFYKRGLFGNNKVFNKELYKKISNNIIDSKILRFWNYLFSNYNSKVLYNSNLFIKDTTLNESINSISYLNSEKNYNNLKDKLEINSAINFYNIDITKQKLERIKDRYDYIYLSNILDRYRFCTYYDFFNFNKNIIEKLDSMLYQDGYLALTYIWCYLDSFLSSTNSINFAYILQNGILNEHNYYIKEFYGSQSLGKYCRPEDRDALILRKKKNK